MVIVLLGTIAAFGTMALFKIPVYSVDTMIPVMLIAIGVAYGIHMHNTIMYLVGKDPLITKDQLINETLTQMTRPVIMAAITTAIGFSALMTSQVLPVRFFGLFSSIGVLSEMLFALLLFPLSIRLLGVPRTGKKREDEDLELPVQGKIKDHAWTTYIMNKGKLITLIALVVAILGGFGAAKIWIDTSFLANFEDDHPISVTDSFVNETFAGTSSINIILSGERPDTFKTPEALSLMDEMQTAFVEDPMIGGSFSLTDFIKRMNFVLNEEQDEFFSIPDNQELIAQYLLLYDMSGDPETIAKVVDYDYQKTNMTLQLKSDSSSLIEKIIAQAETYEDEFGELGITISYAGSGYTSYIFADLLMEGTGSLPGHLVSDRSHTARPRIQKPAHRNSRYNTHRHHCNSQLRCHGSSGDSSQLCHSSHLIHRDRDRSGLCHPPHRTLHEPKERGFVNQRNSERNDIAHRKSDYLQCHSRYGRIYRSDLQRLPAEQTSRFTHRAQYGAQCPRNSLRPPCDTRSPR